MTDASVAVASFFTLVRFLVDSNELKFLSGAGFVRT